MDNLAIITARSGSKGLKDKNIKLLKNKPLIAYSIEAALESQQFSEIMVSTDSLLYAEIAKEYGASIPFMRSASSSHDKASSWDVVKEVLSCYNQKGRRFDTVCLLQPTSPLRISQDIVEGYKLLENKKADAITAVCEMDHSPLWSMPLPNDLSLNEYRKNKNSDKPRQELPIYYRINGALYIRKVQYTDKDILLSDENEYAYIMPKIRSIDIDDMIDFYIAETIINHK